MITAVPREKQLPHSTGDVMTSRRSLIRASPIFFAQSNASNGSSTWSQQGLLRARGKQRHKMTRRRRKKQFTKLSSDNDAPFPKDPFDGVVHTARDKLKQAKGFLAFAGKGNNDNENSANHQPQQQSGEFSTQPIQPLHNSNSRATNGQARATRVRWDLPSERPRQQPKPQTQPQQAKVQISKDPFPILSPSHKFDDNTVENKNATTKIAMNSKQKNDSQDPFKALLQQRMTEIETQKENLSEKILKKDAIKGTLVTAIDGNLEKNRRQMEVLEEELREIKWHLKVDWKRENEEDHDGGRRLARNPSGIYVTEFLEVDDPSIIAETESVAELFHQDKTVRRATAVTGLDPPARQYPTIIEEEEQHLLYRRGREEPDQPQLLAVIRGNNNISTRSNTEPGPNSRLSPSTRQHPSFQHNQHPPTPRHQGRGDLVTQWQKQRGKLVHFNLPSESNSVELKFESINPSDLPSTDFEHSGNEGGGDADISRKTELFGVDLTHEGARSSIPSENNDIHHRTGHEYHVAVSEHHSRENYNGEEDKLESPPTSFDHEKYYGNGGLSSHSAEIDPDLGFLHTVAAVVIQTSVRRFLARIAVEERLYAVMVIQTAICNWMARKQNPYFNSGDIHDNQYSGGIFVHEQNQPHFFRQASPKRTKRVIFEDDYHDFCIFSATEIQRCYRGWWARDSLQLDHFAATTIQRILRGLLTREQLDVDHFCAVEIQRITRGHLCRMAAIYDMYCIIVVQSVARRYIAFYTSAVRLASILYLQAIYRGYRVR